MLNAAVEQRLGREQRGRGLDGVACETQYTGPGYQEKHVPKTDLTATIVCYQPIRLITRQKSVFLAFTDLSQINVRITN